jgi:hypothetical protein
MRKLTRSLTAEYPFAVIEPTRGGHIRLRLPTGKSVFTSATPSDQRACLNTRAEIRRQMRQQKVQATEAVMRNLAGARP